MHTLSNARTHILAIAECKLSVIHFTVCDLREEQAVILHMECSIGLPGVVTMGGRTGGREKESEGIIYVMIYHAHALNDKEWGGRA